MARSIKITPRQYKMLQEATEDSFVYFTDDDTKPYDGQVNISANGKTEPQENGKPVTGDEVARSLTPQGYNRFRSYGNISRAMREGVDINSPQKDKAKDFYDVDGFKNNELNILTDNNDKDDLVKIPQTIQQKLKILLDNVKRLKLTPKQQSIVLNKAIEDLDTDAIPNQWKKELINDIK